MKNRIQMTFSCNQNWDEMKISGPGRHCKMCNCVVHDFTGMSINEIMERSKGKELCGSFSPEQLDPGLVPLQWPRYFKAAVLTAGTVIGLGIGQTQAQDAPDKPKTEISNTSQEIQSAAVTSGPTVESPQTKSGDGVESKPRKRIKRHYLSWRFPFVHRTVVRIGRYRN